MVVSFVAHSSLSLSVHFDEGLLSIMYGDDVI